MSGFWPIPIPPFFLALQVNPGIWNDVALEEIATRNLPKEESASREKPLPLSPNLRALYEATASWQSWVYGIPT